jgi:uncharacterized heparinase superfamily protein
MIMALVSAGCKGPSANRQRLVDKQKLAETTVMRYLHVNSNSDTAKFMHFTQLKNNEIILITDTNFPQTEKARRRAHQQPIYFTLDSTLTKVTGDRTE